MKFYPGRYSTGIQLGDKRTLAGKKIRIIAIGWASRRTSTSLFLYDSHSLLDKKKTRLKVWDLGHDFPLNEISITMEPRLEIRQVS